MEDAFYDSSWTVHSISKVTPSLSKLLAASPKTPQARDEHRERLASHANSFSRELDKDRPRYEREDENEQLGSLKECTWTGLDSTRNQDDNSPTQAGKKRKRETRKNKDQAQCSGLLILLVYEKKTYKFIIYTSTSSSSKRKRTASTAPKKPTTSSANEAAIFLSKSSPAALKALIDYLADTFSLPSIHPLKLAPHLIQSSIETWLATTYTSQLVSYNCDDGAAEDAYLLPYQSLIGTTKLTISFSAPIAPSLKSLEITVPAHTMLRFCEKAETAPLNDRSLKPGFFLGKLASFILEKSGLSVPILQDVQRSLVATQQLGDYDILQSEEEPPMKITKVSAGPFAMSVDSKMNFVSKAVRLARLDPADEDDYEEEELMVKEGDPWEGNCVRRANRDILLMVLEEAQRVGAEEG